MPYQLVSAIAEERGVTRRVSRAKNAIALAITGTCFAMGIAILCMPSASISQPKNLTNASLPASTAADALCSNVYRMYAYWGGSLNAFFDCTDHYASFGVTNLE
jgi:hypothetical protein